MSKKKVVIIDDEVLLCDMLKGHFCKWGFETHSEHDGKKGIETVRKIMPDLVILDLQMPLCTGEEVCKELKEAEETEHIPIIMLTAKKTEVDKIVGKVIGADAYVTKPCSMNDLKEVVYRSLNEKDNF